MTRTLIERAVIVILLVVHAGLLVWALVGWAEMIWPDPPWPRLSNPLFSKGMLFTQWAVITAASVVFLAGYALRWRAMPIALGLCYLAMAATCAVQTFTILVHAGRFVDMALEYAAYVLILIFLTQSVQVRRRLTE